MLFATYIFSLPINSITFILNYYNLTNPYYSMDISEFSCFTPILALKSPINVVSFFLESIDGLRYKRYVKSVIQSNFRPFTLPLTQDATRSYTFMIPLSANLGRTIQINVGAERKYHEYLLQCKIPRRPILPSF